VTLLKAYTFWFCLKVYIYYLVLSVNMSDGSRKVSVAGELHK